MLYVKNIKATTLKNFRKKWLSFKKSSILGQVDFCQWVYGRPEILFAFVNWKEMEKKTKAAFKEIEQLLAEEFPTTVAHSNCKPKL